MLPMTSEEKQLWREESKQITLTFDDGTVLTNEDIYYESFSLEQVLSDDSALTFGKCNPSELKIKIYNIPKSHNGSKLNIKITVDDYTMDFGEYIVVEDKLTDDKQFREIKAYDKLYEISNTDVSEWYRALQFPLSLKTFRDSFFDYLGIEQQSVTLVNDDMVIEHTIDTQTISGKDIIEAICEVNACFGQMSYDGKFKYVTIASTGKALLPSNTLYPSNYLYPSDIVSSKITEYKMGSLKYEDFVCKKITQIQVRMEEGDIGCSFGVDGNTYVIEDNFLLYGKDSAELQDVARNFMVNLHFVEYNPLSVETVGMPWFELGDTLKVVNNRDTLYFPILKRTLKGIQALSDSFEAQGVERYSERVNGIQSEIMRLKGKSNVLTRTIDETKSEITNLDSYIKDNYLTTTQTQSAITQSAEQINLRVDSVQRQVNGQVNTWYGTVTPTLSNYPANQWNTDELKEQHNGDKYFKRDDSGNILQGYRFLLENDAYAWVEMSDTDVQQALQEALRAQSQVEELRSEVDITAKQIQATVGESTTRWTTTYDISYNGFGHPDTNAVLTSVSPLNKYYMNQLDGAIYKCTAFSNGKATWSKVGNAQATKDYVQGQITASAKEVQSTVAQSVTEWDTSSYAITYRGYGQPSQYYTASENYGKYYLNQQNGWIYLSNGSTWSKVAESEAVTDELDSKITQTADSVSSEVKRATSAESSLSSRIAQTASSISLSVDNNGASSGITITVTKENGKTQTATGNINISGFVTFSDLSTSGKTTIAGGNIKTDSLSALSANLGNINAGTVEFATNEITTVGKYQLTKGQWDYYDAWKGEQSLILQKQSYNGMAIAIKRKGIKGNYTYNRDTAETRYGFSSLVAPETTYPFYLNYDGYLYAEKCKIGGEIDIHNGRFKVNEDGNIHTKIGDSAYATKDDDSVIVWCVGHTSGLASDLAIPRRIRFVNGLYVGTEVVSGMSSRNLGSLPTK